MIGNWIIDVVSHGFIFRENPVMQFDVITLFPEMFSALSGSGITRRAFEENRCSLTLWNPRDFTRAGTGRLTTGLMGVVRGCDDGPAAGRRDCRGEKTSRRFRCCRCRRDLSFTARKTSGSCTGHGTCFMRRMVLLCGRYEAIDQRLIDRHVDEEISLGDFVLSGGENTCHGFDGCHHPSVAGGVK